jgi:ATP-binding cassette subfamily F protein uup
VPRPGAIVFSLEGVGHRFDGPGANWLFRDLDLALEPGGRVGVVGPNGSGKTTLLDILAGRLAPAAGTVDTAPSVRLGYYDQVGGKLDPAMRVREAVAGAAGQPSWDQVRLMERFWFDADAQWAPIGTLSGGERRRLQLLLVLTSRPNVLLLDEPTNDLDLDTLRSVEDHLETWPGSLVVVSHDRALLERTVEDVVVLDGRGGSWLPAGGYAEYAAARRRVTRAGPSPAEPVAGGKGPAATQAGPAGRKPRSSSTLRRLVSQAEREMVEAAEERSRLEAALAAVGAGAGADYTAVAAAASALAEADARLAEAEQRWLALAEELG